MKNKTTPKVETVEEEALPDVTEESVGSLSEDVSPSSHYIIFSWFSPAVTSKSFPFLMLYTNSIAFRSRLATKGLCKSVETCRK